MDKLKDISWESMIYMILICFVGFFGGIGIAIVLERLRYKRIKKYKVLPYTPPKQYIVVINPIENPQIGVINE